VAGSKFKERMSLGWGDRLFCYRSAIVPQEATNGAKGWEVGLAFAASRRAIIEKSAIKTSLHQTRVWFSQLK